MFHFFFIFVLLQSFLFASDLNTTQENLVDSLHKNISKKIETFSNVADDGTSGLFSFFTRIAKETKTNPKVLNPKSVDALFQNEKFIEDTSKSYIRISTDYQNNSLGDSDFNVRLNARLDLRKSKKNLKLFISDFNQDNVGDIVEKKEANDNNPEVGLSYVQILMENLKTKYSIGIRSLYPFAKTRISYKKNLYSWDIEPIQNFEYSTKDEFKEDTRVYADKEVMNKVLFRTEIGRGTSSDTDGMSYDAAMHLFWTPQSKTGLSLTQAVYGNTQYQIYTDDSDTIKESYKGINNYLTQITFRQNIYRKWLFYEISPSVNFAKTNDFEANYRLYIRLDLFLGNM